MLLSNLFTGKGSILPYTTTSKIVCRPLNKGLRWKHLGFARLKTFLYLSALMCSTFKALTDIYSSLFILFLCKLVMFISLFQYLAMIGQTQQFISQNVMPD